MLIQAHLTIDDLEQVRRVLDGELPFKPPYKGFSLDAAVYVSLVPHNSSQAITVQSVAIDMGLSDGCEVIVDPKRAKKAKELGRPH